MAQLDPKSNLDTVIRYVDWAPLLDCDVIATSAYALTSGTITITRPLRSATETAFTIGGGAVGETATFTNTITTCGGQTLEQDVTIYVEASIGSFGLSTATKDTVLQMAFEELALAGYEFDHGADEIASALRKLDGVMADPSMPDIGYNYPAVFGEGDKLDPVGIPDSAVQTVAISLGLRIMPSMGKTMSPETRRAYSEGMNSIRAMKPIPCIPLRRGTPLGTGNKWRSIWRPFATGYNRPGFVSA